MFLVSSVGGFISNCAAVIKILSSRKFIEYPVGLELMNNRELLIRSSSDGTCIVSDE